jgi:hypothetical protein
MSMRRISIRLSEADPDDAVILELWDKTVPKRRAGMLRRILKAGLRTCVDASSASEDGRLSAAQRDSPAPAAAHGSSKSIGKKPLSALSGLLTGD